MIRSPKATFASVTGSGPGACALLLPNPTGIDTMRSSDQRESANGGLMTGIGIGDYGTTARYYDKIYASKDYEAESALLVALIERSVPAAETLLDVACGTGRHIEYLKDRFDPVGLDASEQMLTRARLRNPNATFHCGDMVRFTLGRTFDVVTCLFSAIGYARTLPDMRATVRCMADHLNPGGIVAIEPWFTPSEWHTRRVHALLIDEPELKIARVSTSHVEGRVSSFDFHYLIGTPDGTKHAVEHHELGLFRTEELVGAAQDAGLSVSYDEKGLTGRGLLLGVKDKGALLSG